MQSNSCMLLQKKNIVGKSGILIIHSDNKNDIVQNIEYLFQNDHFQLNIKINPNKWNNDIFKNILNDVKNEIISYDAEFFNYFDQKECKENKQTFYFSTKFKKKWTYLFLNYKKKTLFLFYYVKRLISNLIILDVAYFPI